MASRLYPTTQDLFRQVSMALAWLGVLSMIGSPTQFNVMALYIAGLILLQERQTPWLMAQFLPGRCHDALNRLLRVVPWSTRALMRLLIAYAKRQVENGYLSLDDVVIPKPFAKCIPWVGWTFSPSKGGKVRGLHMVVLLWCHGKLKIPVAFRLWRPRQNCRRGQYRTKIQLARQMVIEVRAEGLPFEYIVFDSWYNAKWFAKWLNRCGIIWVSVLKSNRCVVYRHRRQQVRHLAKTLPLQWREQLALQAVALRVYLPQYGTILLVVTRNGRGKWEYIVTNDLYADLTTVVERKRSRWDIEEMFKDAQQMGGLAACQSRVDQAMVRHVALVLVTYVVLERLKIDLSETQGDVKRRFQLQAITGDAKPPKPLRARAA
jgi:hypothetical protein